MGQGEVLKYLVKNHGRYVDIQELMRVLPYNRVSISRACKQLVDAKDVKIKKVTVGCFTKYLFSV